MLLSRNVLPSLSSFVRPVVLLHEVNVNFQGLWLILYFKRDYTGSGGVNGEGDSFSCSWSAD